MFPPPRFTDPGPYGPPNPSGIAQMNLYTQLPAIVQGAGSGQPAFLNGWFSFWSGVAAWQPMLITYGVGALELGIAFALIAGFLTPFLAALCWWS